MRAKDNGINLHELFKKRSYDHGLISTFTFSVRFFEEYALDRFKALQNNSNLTVFLDRGEYEEILTATTATKDWSPRLANLRYLLHPIRVPGVFHPKVFLFANAKHGLLVIGSANFSQDGLGANAELVSAFEYEAGKNETTLPLFQSALRFFEDLLERWPGKEAASNVGDLKRNVPWLTEEPKHAVDKRLPQFLSNLDEPLWPQLMLHLPGKVDRLSLVSRFFDSSPQMLDAIMRPLGAASVDIYTQAAIHTLGPAWLEHPLRKKKKLSIHLCRYEDEDHSQQLHGKAYAFSSGKQTSLACGSANFSTAALLRPAASGNVEVLLVYPPDSVGRLKPEDLFDPLQSATELKSVDLKVTDDQTTEPVSRAGDFQILLQEAVLDESELTIEADAAPSGIECRILQANKRPVSLVLGSIKAGSVRLKLAPGLARSMADAPSVAQLGTRKGEDWEALSNPVLVAAPMGPISGKNSRQQRRIKEAIESPQRFMGVLRELCESDDETRLKNFLTHCDIPFAPHLKSSGGLRKSNSGPSAPPTDFKDLGTRNLRHFDMLHDAVVNFVARHRTRLERHVESGTAAGISNYLHILESVVRLLQSQIERAASGLEHEPLITLTPDEWKRIRENLSDYYRELESLLRLTTREYVAALLKEEKKKAVRDGFGSATDEILSLLSQCIPMRGRIDIARAERVRVRTIMGTTEQAIFFGEQLSDQKWKNYVLSLKALADELRKQLAA